MEPGWRRFLVRPVPGGTIRSAAVGYESVHGEISCEWKVEGEKRFKLKLQVPQDAIALVVLPKQGRTSIMDNEIWKTGQELLGPGTFELEFDCDCYDGWPPKPLLTQWRDPEDEDDTFV